MFRWILNNRLQRASRVGVVTNALNKRNTKHWIRGVNNAFKALLECDLASVIIHQSTLLQKLSALLVFWTEACRFPSKTVSSPHLAVPASQSAGLMTAQTSLSILQPLSSLSTLDTQPGHLLELQANKTNIADKRSYSFSGEKRIGGIHCTQASNQNLRLASATKEPPVLISGIKKVRPVGQAFIHSGATKRIV